MAAKKPITLTWDCGGDETLIDGKIGKDRWRWEDTDFQTLCEILIRELQLPNAGEEFNKGGGKIVLKDGSVVLNYQATFFGATWDEEEEDIVEEEAKELKGDLLLFK